MASMLRCSLFLSRFYLVSFEHEFTPGQRLIARVRSASVRIHGPMIDSGRRATVLGASLSCKAST